MSNSSDFQGFSGRASAKFTDKSNFSQTCSLLSQYLKQKGSFADLTSVMASNDERRGKTEPDSTGITMDLLPKVGTRKDEIEKAQHHPPQQEVPGLCPSLGPKQTEPMRATSEPETAPMTLFYAGKVLVFDSFPADKAKEIMLMASKESKRTHLVENPPSLESASSLFSQNGNSNTTPLLQKQNSISSVPQLPGVTLGLKHSPASASPGCKNLTAENHQRVLRTGNAANNLLSGSSDLPMARKASLQRFLEKRKDRISSTGPYPVDVTTTHQTKVDNVKPWLALASLAGERAPAWPTDSVA